MASVCGLGKKIGNLVVTKGGHAEAAARKAKWLVVTRAVKRLGRR